MRKAFIGFSLLALACFNLQLPAHALDWFNKWDADHNGSWNMQEYRAAQMNWCRHHHRRCNPAMIQQQFNTYDRNHDGRLMPGDVEGIHHWQ